MEAWGNQPCTECVCVWLTPFSRQPKSGLLGPAALLMLQQRAFSCISVSKRQNPSQVHTCPQQTEQAQGRSCVTEQADPDPCHDILSLL
jgi:hypothetical protein